MSAIKEQCVTGKGQLKEVVWDPEVAMLWMIGQRKTRALRK